ncbi:hypothetical protein AVW11_16950 [Streptomyces amritsarensis]|uniref:Uncharacterized protein n=1 Tax=Streptomyces amritsarensis TaxID=681158 RepID=A0ABX3G5F8_9ACTN|nr:hypothetical protein AVW11_16950 [Streptomyces amritsarensis]
MGPEPSDGLQPYPKGAARHNSARPTTPLSHSLATPRTSDGKRLPWRLGTGIPQLRNKCTPPTSKKLGCCLECHDGTPVDPSSCMTGPAPPVHRLAA